MRPNSRSSRGLVLSFTVGLLSLVAVQSGAQESACPIIDKRASFAEPGISPDGTGLAFVSNRTGSGDIYVLTLESGNLLRIMYSDGGDLLERATPGSTPSSMRS
jgi:Tol biopolymer transport system component